MALTLWKIPQELQPTYNQVVLVATSSFQSELNYQLVTDLWCRGSKVTTLKTPVNPEGYVVVDLHKHLENRVSFDFQPGLTGFTPATQSFASYSCVFSDEFRHEWEFTDNQYNVIGGTSYAGFVSRDTPYFSVGDSIYVAQDAPYTNASYNGVHTILSITQSGLTWSVVTDALWGSSTPPEPGVITYASYQLTKVAVTQSVVWENGTSSNTFFPKRFVFNGVESYLDFINWNFDDYDANTGTTQGQFFTNAPSYYELDVDSYMFLNMYQNANDEIKTLKIKTNLGTYSITNSFTSIANDQRRFLQVNASPRYFSTQGWIDSNTTNIELWVENTSGTKTIASKFYKITDRCSKYDKLQLVFLDKMGSFIPYTFDRVNRQVKNITRSDYQQFYGSYASATKQWKYDTWDRGRKSLDIIVNEVYTLNSDWVNQSTSDYLMELFESPEVYLVKSDGTICAINVTVQSIERKQVINEQLINYQLTFEMSNKNMSQRG